MHQSDASGRQQPAHGTAAHEHVPVPTVDGSGLPPRFFVLGSNLWATSSTVRGGYTSGGDRSNGGTSLRYIAHYAAITQQQQQMQLQQGRTAAAAAAASAAELDAAEHASPPPSPAVADGEPAGAAEVPLLRQGSLSLSLEETRSNQPAALPPGGSAPGSPGAVSQSADHSLAVAPLAHGGVSVETSSSDDHDTFGHASSASVSGEHEATVSPPRPAKSRVAVSPEPAVDPPARRRPPPVPARPDSAPAQPKRGLFSLLFGCCAGGGPAPLSPGQPLPAPVAPPEGATGKPAIPPGGRANRVGPHSSATGAEGADSTPVKPGGRAGGPGATPSVLLARGAAAVPPPAGARVVGGPAAMLLAPVDADSDDGAVHAAAAAAAAALHVGLPLEPPPFQVPMLEDGTFQRLNNVSRPASASADDGPLLGPLVPCDVGRPCLVLDLDETLGERRMAALDDGGARLDEWVGTLLDTLRRAPCAANVPLR